MIKVQCSAVLILDFTSIYFFIYYLGYLYILPTTSSEKKWGFCQNRGPLSKTFKTNVMTDMPAFWREQDGPARTHVSPKNNHEKNVTSELWERYDWTNSEEEKRDPNEKEKKTKLTHVPKTA